MRQYFRMIYYLDLIVVVVVLDNTDHCLDRFHCKNETGRLIQSEFLLLFSGSSSNFKWGKAQSLRVSFFLYFIVDFFLLSPFFFSKIKRSRHPFWLAGLLLWKCDFQEEEEEPPICCMSVCVYTSVKFRIRDGPTPGRSLPATLRDVLERKVFILSLSHFFFFLFPLRSTASISPLSIFFFFGFKFDSFFEGEGREREREVQKRKTQSSLFLQRV